MLPFSLGFLIRIWRTIF